MKTNIIDRIKLLFYKKKELYHKFYNILGFYPHNIELYEIALSHRSQQYHHRDGRTLNNERLEFLGDAVLETVVSDILYHYYQNKREGFLTNTRSKLVKRDTLNDLAKKMGLLPLIHLSNPEMAANTNIGGNAFEAFLGAIYLDRGFDACYHFIYHRVFKQYINLEEVAKKEVNFKSKIIEWGQKYKVSVDFQTHHIENTDKLPLFISEVLLGSHVVGHGEGHNKKDSHQRASAAALKTIYSDTKLRHQIIDSANTNPNESTTTPPSSTTEQ